MKKARFTKIMKLARRIIKDKPIDLKNYEITRDEYEALKDAVSFLKDKFPNKGESWVLRAIVRALNAFESGNNRWIVRGTDKLGDQYGFYRVTYFESSNKYTCSCYTTSYGNTRKRRICTHIAGVMLYRRWRSILIYYMKKDKSEFLNEF